MSSIPPPPAPTHLLRTHLAPISSLWFSDDNERLYSGDAKGNIVVTSTRSLRPLAQWQAHTDGILGIEEWNGHIITHGRDNKLHVWSLVQETATKVGGSATAPGLSAPTLHYSMDVNALNYCRFSLMPLDDDTALIALPNLLESSMADIWELPSQKRLHAAVGKGEQPMGSDGRGPNPIGIIMSMHLFFGPPSNESSRKQLRLLCAYENGSVTLRGYTRGDAPSIEGIGWESLWTVKLHVESVMAMAVSKKHDIAFTVSADHLIGRYDLLAATEDPERASAACTVHRTKIPGNGSIAIRDDGRVCAVGGWDGKIRLFSTKSLKPLGTLDYHKSSCQALAFARYRDETPASRTADEDSEDELSADERAERRRWLAGGGPDNRVSIWCLISFERG